VEAYVIITGDTRDGSSWPLDLEPLSIADKQKQGSTGQLGFGF
jgi:hypothetical protein